MFAGLLQLEAGGLWYGAVCADGFSDAEATLVCQKLGMTWSDTWAYENDGSAAVSLTCDAGAESLEQCTLAELDSCAGDLVGLECYPGAFGW